MAIYDASYNNFVELREDAELFAESRQELESMIDHFTEARRFISNLKDEIAKEQQFNCGTQEPFKMRAQNKVLT